MLERTLPGLFLLLFVPIGCTTAASMGEPDAGPPLSHDMTESRADGPARTVVTDDQGSWLATFTDGAYTVLLRGPDRRFTEKGWAGAVESTVSVRTLPVPFDGVVDRKWLDAALTTDEPDVLYRALAYVTGGPSDASYGPLAKDGKRLEGSDFNDYLGISWSFPNGEQSEPEARRKGTVDCSGFMRLVFGYLGDVPLGYTPTDDRSLLPRRAVGMVASAPGVPVIPDRGVRPVDLEPLRTGDLVFFDAATDDGTAIDHVGLYLGLDADGNHRFVSSRKWADGPTFGDVGGPSILNGEGLYARTFRAARRL